MSACDECRFNLCELVVKGDHGEASLFNRFCEEDSPNYMSIDGCYHFQERPYYDD